jgi:uncharacterized membrane protein YuzA (DUF378 family)
MEFLRRMDPLWILLIVLGGITWLVLGLFGTNLVTEVLGDGTAADVAYCILGIGVLAIMPRLLEGMHLSGHRHGVRPTGA